MKTTIEKILGKPSDYWVCPNCKVLNWYENEKCTDRLEVGCEQDYEANDSLVLDFVNEEIKFYLETFYDSEEDCYRVEINL